MADDHALAGWNSQPPGPHITPEIVQELIQDPDAWNPHATKALAWPALQQLQHDTVPVNTPGQFSLAHILETSTAAGMTCVVLPHKRPRAYACSSVCVDASAIAPIAENL
jgi:hypothetical protein